MRKIYQFPKYFAGIFSLLVLSCSDSNDLVLPDSDIGQTVNYKVSKEEAISTLNSILDITYQSTRGEAKREISSIEFLTNKNSSLTRSVNELDTIMYAINFTNDAGYALMSTDRRSDPIYALVDNGNFSREEQCDNPGLELFMEMAENYFYTTIEENNVSTRSSQSTYDWVLANRTGPKISYKWNQGHPFNKFCPPLGNGSNCAVGCTAVATGMILAMHQKPDNINGHDLNWSKISQMKTAYDLNNDSEGCNQVARFLYELGRKMDMNYGQESGAWPNDALNYMRNELGMWAPRMSTYDADANFSIYSTLHFDTKGLIMMSGYRQDGDTKKGHTWVLDGQIFMKDRNNPNDKQLDLYHCAWGWGGSSDGYYLRYIFDRSSGTTIEFTENSPRNYIINLEYSRIPGN